MWHLEKNDLSGEGYEIYSDVEFGSEPYNDYNWKSCSYNERCLLCDV